MQTAASRAVAVLVAALTCAVAGCAPSDSRPFPATRTPSAVARTAGVFWTPPQGASFQVQYAGKLDLTIPVDVYDLDWESTTADDVAMLHQRGARVLCYVNAGAFENWRGDRQSFPASVIGAPLKDWPGENWLDVTKIDVLLPIMSQRMDTCAAKGFDGVDPDNTDGYTQKSGFSITPAAQLAYQKALAAAAHQRGMSLGLKNAPDQVAQLTADVDFAVNEECNAYAECDKYAGFLKAGKAVFNIEYEGDPATVCPRKPAGMTTVFKSKELTAEREAC